MVEFVVVLDSAGMVNPDTELNSLVPELVEAHSAGRVQSDGWTFAADDTMQLFFSATNADQGAHDIRVALASAPVLGNDISGLTIAVRHTNHGAFTSIHPAAALGSLIPDIND